MRKDLLNDGGRGLRSVLSVNRSMRMRMGDRRTWTLAVQSDVMAVILDPETPGALSASMDWRISSNSATAEVMLTVTVVKSTQLRHTIYHRISSRPLLG